MTAKKDTPPESGTVVTETSTRTTQIPESVNDLPIEGWLLELGGKSNVATVRVYKRDASGRWGALPRGHGELQPPFDIDLQPIYEAYGDGEYRFAPMGQASRPLTGVGTVPRIESVIGFGLGKAIKILPSASNGTAPVDVDAMWAKMMEQDRQQFLMEQMRARAEAQRGVPAQAERNSDDELERLMKFAALLRGGGNSELGPVLAAMIQSNTSIMTALLSKSMNPPEPADKMFDTVSKVLDLTERVRSPIEGGEDLDWKKMIVMALAPAAQQLLPALLQNRRAVPTSTAPPPRPALPHIPQPNPDHPSPASRDVSQPTPPASVPAPAEVTPGDQRIVAAHELFQSSLWPLLVTAAKRGSTDYDLYLGLIDETLPGFVDQWASMPFDLCLPFLTSIDPHVEQDSVLMTWLRALHAHVQQQPADETEPRTEPFHVTGGSPTVHDPQQD